MNTVESSGYAALIEILHGWGINHYLGVTGGGVIHLVRHLKPYTDRAQSSDDVPRMLTMSEYAAGFGPLGYFLASNRVAVCVTTTGAATKLAMSGLSDAKLHNIPAIYLVALNSTPSKDKAPLQDVSESGINILPQIQAEVGDACIVLDDIDRLGQSMESVQTLLGESKPVVLAFYPDILSRPTGVRVPKRVWPELRHEGYDLGALLRTLAARAGRVIIYVGSEAARCPGITDMTTALSERLGAPTVWSVNGANAVSPENRHGFGYISFGGNDAALALWHSVGHDDIVLALGFDPGEYTLNLDTIRAGHVFHLTDIRNAYGHKHGSFQHRVAGQYHLVRGDIGGILSELLVLLGPDTAGAEAVAAPRCLNTRNVSRKVKDGSIDIVAFYEALLALWRPETLGFDDVCMAYKDRQYIWQRPHAHARFYALQEGSAMGGAFGLGVGAKIAAPHLHTFIFSGDGCFRLFGGALADAANLDLRLFILDNGCYSIVEAGLRVILPDIDERYYHGKIPKIDFVKAAEAHGWGACRLSPDLSNLSTIMDRCYTTQGRSILVEVPVDGDQDVGANPRVQNLKIKSYL